MLYAIEVHAQLAHERIEREIAFAAERRRYGLDQPSSIRRAIGHRFIAIGARLASEPSLESGGGPGGGGGPAAPAPTPHLEILR